MNQITALKNCLARCTDEEVARKLRERIDYVETLHRKIDILDAIEETTIIEFHK